MCYDTHIKKKKKAPHSHHKHSPKEDVDMKGEM